MTSRESISTNHQAFGSFYDTYAPKLWGLILTADFPAPQAEAILINTLRKAWVERALARPTEPYFLTRLVGLACQEGLPIGHLQTLLSRNGARAFRHIYTA